MPLLLIQITAVVNSPRSPDVRERTCCLPLTAIIFDGVQKYQKNKLTAS